MSLPNELMPVGLLGTGTATSTVSSTSRSLRFNSADSAYLSRTPGSAGNRRTWTWAAWVKRAKLGSGGYIFSSDPNSSNYFVLYWDSGVVIDALSLQEVSGGSVVGFRRSASVYRDPSAWYHIVLAVDTTQATANNRIKMYVNGTEITTFNSSTNYSQNADTQINSTSQHNIGRMVNFAVPFDGYLADIHFIDGQALTPSSFGEFDATTGVWNPLSYSGTYGTNGFKLSFSDNSAATAAALGKDSAGSNNWTPNNLSVTAGAGNDSLRDSPTNGTASSGGDAGGTVVGNYATLNPLVVFGTSTFTNGNLDVSVSSLNTNNFATFAIPSSGKWYWEYQITAIGGGAAPMAGVILTGDSGLTNSTVYRANGDKIINGTGSAYGATYTTTDIIGVAVDVDGGTITFYKNNTSQGAITYATSSGNYSPALRSNAATDNFTFNFGQRPFAYAAPAGFKSLNTANLPTPTILKGSDYFQTVLYTGSGSTQTISGLAFSPDFVWIKNRSLSGRWHNLFDQVRGVYRRLFSNDTSAETNDVGYNLNSFTSDGFTLLSTDRDTNSSAGDSYVAWCWDAGSSNATNTSGSITSTVRANASAGFSIVTYTGSSSGSTVGHGLGVAPAFIIGKRRDGASEWSCYHQSLGNAQAIILNTTAAGGGSSTWNYTSPTSSVITFGAAYSVNYPTYTHVLYCFAPVSGYSSFGSYTGNGSTDGPFVYLGFRPRYILIRSTTGARDWLVWDTARDSYNVSTSGKLSPNLSDAEYYGGGAYGMPDVCANGFKLKVSTTNMNANSEVHIYAAFAENPFSIARAR